MKGKYILWILLGLAALFTTVSCKSDPPAVEETPPPVTQTPPPPARDPAPDQPALDALESAAARAEAARKQVSDFNGPALFSSDWNAADSLYTEAGQRKDTSTLRLTQDSTARYNRAADAFEAMSGKTFAAYYEGREKELDSARAAALNARAGELVPDYLLAADNSVLDARTRYEAKDYYGAKDAADKSLFMYTSLKSGLDAYKVREEIADRGFDVYDPINVELADDTLRSAAGDYEAGNFAAAKEKSDAARLRYDQAIGTAWVSFSAEKGAEASTERQKALDNKANVAVRQDYNAAQAVFVRANSAFQGGKYDEAAGLYDECISSFGVLSQAALEKRQAAEAALKEANEKMAESDETARNAEIILEGGAE